MEKLKNKLSVIQQKVQRFRQQQFTFITALERTRERAQQRTKPISSIAQVQCCLDEYCQNATDRRVLSLFLEIVHDLNGLLQQTENQFTAASNQQIESLEECKRLLNPNNDLSRLRARYPHDEVNRLSCDEARNYYGGVVSLIPIILDHLQQGLLSLIYMKAYLLIIVLQHRTTKLFKKKKKKKILLPEKSLAITIASSRRQFQIDCMTKEFGETGN
uniref:Sperm acrosome associated 9 n=1 Tax=Erpetoichthys calabaricus TaxID=27687 RepID=A0A8C4X807_ERPCA